MKDPDPRNSAPFINRLLLKAMLDICKNAEAPDNLIKTIEQVMDAQVYDNSVNLRREADAFGADLAEELLDLISEQISGDDEPEIHSGFGSIVSPEVAEENKILWKEAISKSRNLRLKYVSDTSGYSEREVEPRTIRGPYGEGYCFLREDERVFRFDRMFDVKVSRG